METEKFIALMEEKKQQIDAAIGKANELTDPQKDCYIAHAGQCGVCDADGGWTGC